MDDVFLFVDSGGRCFMRLSDESHCIIVTELSQTSISRGMWNNVRERMKGEKWLEKLLSPTF